MIFKLFELYFLDFFAFTQKHRIFMRRFCCASFLSTHFGETHMTRTHHHLKKKKSAVHGLPLTQAAVGGILSSGVFTLVGMLRLSLIPWW